MFFNGWENLGRTLVVGVLAYATIVIFLRISGKRTLSKMNVFDLIVTVALGSILASVVMNKDIALVEGALAFALLIGLQFALTWLSVRARWVRQLVTGQPLMVLYRGEFLHAAMRRSRVAEDEVRAAVRAAGLASMFEAEAVVLETDGSFSVVRRGNGKGRPSLDGVEGPELGNEFAEPNVEPDTAGGEGSHGFGQQHLQGK